MRITDAYSSPEMYECVKRLYEFKRKWDSDFGCVFQQLLQNNTDPAYVARVDEARRRFSHYFHQMKALLDCDVVDENFVKKLVKSDQVDTLLDIVEPLEKAKDEDYDHSTFDLFRKMYRKL